MPELASPVGRRLTGFFDRREESMGKILKRPALAEVPAETQKREPTVKVTLEFPYTLVVRLTSVAAKERMPRNQFLQKLADQGLRKYRFDEIVRAGLMESQVEAQEVGQALRA
jgi:hypothetical protein